ncbi:MAG: diaminopimelate epimerase [Bacteriovorax sp.]|nr:diaminopimelate epimerase [Bacteriovorax sp.]
MERFNLEFTKMNATGNDFIVIDNRNQIVSADNREHWKKLCSLKTGIGADGVLLLEKSAKADFRMRYINADGGEVEMCGNGGRAITAFAHDLLEPKKNTYQFETMNGIYECSIDLTHGYRLKMTELYDVDTIKLDSLNIKNKHSIYMNTGVPHCVFEVENILEYPVFEHGKSVRYSPIFPKGSNANFFEVIGTKHLRVRTYERGVENETLSCGTGVTAAAIAAAKFYNWSDEIILETLGGRLAVQFNSDFSEVYLCGKVEKVFIGRV